MTPADPDSITQDTQYRLSKELLIHNQRVIQTCLTHRELEF